MTTYLPTIDKEQIATLPPCSRTGQIFLIDKAEMVDIAIADLRKSGIIGFDTESKPAFQRGKSNTISLLQLATPNTAYLFRLKKIGIHEGLKALLEDDDVTKIGLSVHDDFLSLNNWMPCAPRHFVELQKYVSAFGIEEKSLLKIYAIIFGEKMSKQQRMSNWDAETLSGAQERYAAIDAWACLDIYNELRRNCSLQLQKI